MKKRTQFRIESIEELIEAYYHFEDRWYKKYDLESEIRYFNLGLRYINCNEDGKFLLGDKHPYYKIVENPLKKDLFRGCGYSSEYEILREAMLNLENSSDKVYAKDVSGNENHGHIFPLTGIQKALISLENEADKLGFDVDVRINPKK